MDITSSTTYNVLLDIAVLTTLLGLALYFFSTWGFGYFKKHNVRYLSPSPFVGNLWNVLTAKESYGEIMKRTYNTFPDQKLVGLYEFQSSTVLIRDPELIRMITVKDFEHFTDHSAIVDEKADPLFGKNLFALKGQRWRAMRTTLSPAFTSSKMKGMFKLITECADGFTKHLQKTALEGRQVLEMKDLFTRYTNDVIATAAFGIQVNSLAERENEFYTVSKKATNFSGLLGLKFFLSTAYPELFKLLRVKLTQDDVSKFFRDLIENTIATREAKGIVRPDMLQLLMQAKKGTLSDEKGEPAMRNMELTDDDITAQALIFLLAGFDTASVLMCFTSHELAVNPDIQDRLRAEIDEVRASNPDVNYEVVNKMKYLDMVISESLRKWPPADFIERVCVKPYVLKDEKNNIEFELPVGKTVAMPMLAIHRDPNYFPDPDKFDPERFNDDNKNSIKAYTYLPFGAGPRVCIGSRFVHMETKLVLFHLLTHFTLEVSEKTQVPLQLSKDFVMGAQKGFWLELKTRDDH